MATDGTGGPESGGEGAPSGEGEDGGDPGAEPPVAVDEYTWANFVEEYAETEVAANPRDLPAQFDPSDADGFEPASYLGFDPAEATDRVERAAAVAKGLEEHFLAFSDPETTPVVKDEWLWEHFKWEYYYDEDGFRPRDDDGAVVPFDPASYLGFDPDEVEGRLSFAESQASALADLVDRRTVDVNPDVDEDAFFSTVDGQTTVANRYDLEKAVPVEKKLHFREIDRYWVNKPYAFVVLFHSDRENEKKYYLVEPYRTEIEANLRSFLTEKLRTAIKYADDEVTIEGAESERRAVIEREARKLLDRYDLYDGPARPQGGFLDRIRALLGRGAEPEDTRDLEGLSTRPEPAILEEDPETLNEYQVEKLVYLLKRDFIGYERIDGIKHDINVEDISCDGYNSPVFVYHTDHEQIITNVEHGRESLDDFVVKLAQRSGKGISKRQPQVDATLPDGSRAQLTLGREVSDHGTNYTIRQFKDVPFTPIDLINWQTFSLEEMAFLWLCIENNKSLIFAGGTASGKTTSLNAVSLFIPSNTKIVSIEDTREVELPQRNWVASVTRPSFADGETGDIDEFDLLEAALRQRPDYIVMGEVRGEEGRTLFQVMSTGHTTYTTFHADSVGEVLKRFTTDPINVSKTLFTALDLVSIQTSTRVQGNKVRRNRVLTEINHYDPENDEINVQDVFQWTPESDEFQRQPASSTLDEIMFDRGWSQQTLEDELFKRQVVLAYLIANGLNDYAQVAATVQAFINDPETILTLIANDRLEESLADLRGMESVLIDIDPEKEEMVPRPDPNDALAAHVEDILAEAESRLFEDYEGEVADLELALSPEAVDEDVQVTADQARSAGVLGPEDDAPALDGDDDAPNRSALPGGTAADEGDSAREVGADGGGSPRAGGDADDDGDDGGGDFGIFEGVTFGAADDATGDADESEGEDER